MENIFTLILVNGKVGSIVLYNMRRPIGTSLLYLLLYRECV